MTNTQENRRTRDDFIDQLLTEIARKHLSITTLEARNADSLDFHDVSVWALKDALQEVFEARGTSKINT